MGKTRNDASRGEAILKQAWAEVDAAREQLEAIAAERDNLKRDNDAYRTREEARFRSDQAAAQRKRQESERADRRKRRQELSDGMLRLKDATEWAIVSDERGKVLELTVPLSGDVEPIVHGVLTKKDEPSRPFSISFTFARDINPIEPTLAGILRSGHHF